LPQTGKWAPVVLPAPQAEFAYPCLRGKASTAGGVAAQAPRTPPVQPWLRRKRRKQEQPPALVAAAEAKATICIYGNNMNAHNEYTVVFILK
jgi:hypothetical protein